MKKYFLAENKNLKSQPNSFTRAVEKLMLAVKFWFDFEPTEILLGACLWK